MTPGDRMIDDQDREDREDLEEARRDRADELRDIARDEAAADELARLERRARELQAELEELEPRLEALR